MNTTTHHRRATALVALALALALTAPLAGCRSTTSSATNAPAPAATAAAPAPAHYAQLNDPEPSVRVARDACVTRLLASGAWSSSTAIAKCNAAHPRIR